jgi:hypothetical protein
MIDINKEAEEYADYKNDYIPIEFGNERFNKSVAKHFIAGHNSKATQAKVIQAQIDTLLKYQQKLGGYEPLTGALKQDIQLDIYELQKQLKQLEDGN